MSGTGLETVQDAAQPCLAERPAGAENERVGQLSIHSVICSERSKGRPRDAVRSGQGEH